MTRSRLASLAVLLLMLVALPLLFAGGEDTAPRIVATATLPALRIGELQNAKLPGSLANDRGHLLGGIGSDLWRSAGMPAGSFWMVTDRGPNGQMAVSGANRRTFPVPDFTPVIVRVQINGARLDLIDYLPIVGQSGRPVTGLPNIDGFDEVPYDYTAQTRLPAYNPSGLDTEGLVRTSRGDFWLVDEYTPSLLNVGADGKVIRRYIPAGINLQGADYPVTANLPAIYGKRKANRGFEGLAMSPDEQTLYVVLQSPLLNPNTATGNASRITRILAFDIASQTVTAEYAYAFENVDTFDPKVAGKPDEMKLSGTIALGGGRLLILERTDAVANVYEVDLAGATNLLGGRWGDAATSPTLESLNPSALAAAGVTPLSKRLLVELNSLPGMPGKIEGIAIVDSSTLAVANDNDFDIGTFDAQGNHIGASGSVSQILYVRIPGANFTLR